MGEKDYSAEAVAKFLDFAGSKGVLKANTARTRKTAFLQVLAGADEEERKDVRRIDVESVFRRFENLKGREFRGETLNVYRSRFQSALTDFLSWVESPSSFRPSTAVRHVPVRKRKQEAVVEDGASRNAVPYSQPLPDCSRTLSAPIWMPVPLEGVSVTIKIENIPSDLSTEEATKVTKIMQSLTEMVRALATERINH